MNSDHLPNVDPTKHAISHRRATFIAITVSLIAPFVACFLVIDSLVGIENLKRHYWFTDGLAISAGLNTIAFLPLLFSRVRRMALRYSVVVALAISVLAFVGYGWWMISLVGV